MLPARQAQAAALRFVYDMPIDEIAGLCSAAAPDGSDVQRVGVNQNFSSLAWQPVPGN